MNIKEKRILDLLYIAPYKQGNSEGWLVKVPINESQKKKRWHSKLFNFNATTTPDEALEKARKYRNDWLEAHADSIKIRPWRDWGGAGITTQLQANNTSGIPGVYRTTRSLRSGNIAEEWNASFKTIEGKEMRPSFSVKKYGEIGALIRAVAVRRDFLCEIIRNESYRSDQGIPDLRDLYIDIISHLTELLDQYSDDRSVLEIAQDSQMHVTSKYDEIQIRVGQHRFRREVLTAFGFRCAVCGTDILVRASHIKPWKDSSDEERIDPDNGIALSPLHDATFDRGYISFDSLGNILISRAHRSTLLKMGIRDDDKIALMNSRRVRFLDWHRKYIFKSGANKGIESTESASAASATHA